MLLSTTELQYGWSVSSGSANSIADVAFERELSYRCSSDSGSVMGSSTVAAVA